MYGMKSISRHEEASAGGGSFAQHGGLIARHVSFCCPIKPIKKKKIQGGP